MDAILRKLSQTHKDWVVCFVSYEEPTLKKKIREEKKPKDFWGKTSRRRGDRRDCGGGRVSANTVPCV